MRQFKVSTLISVAIALLFTIGFFSNNVYAESAIFTESEVTIDSVGEYYLLEFNDGVKVVSVKSSNTKVIEISESDYDEDEDEDYYSDYVYIYAEGVGTATVTATDSEGNNDTCKVTVKPDPLELDETEVIFDKYNIDSYDYEESDYYRIESNNPLKSAKSSDASIAKTSMGTDYFNIIPVSAGEAVITVIDKYRQTAQVRVEISSKYIDDMKYLGVMKDAEVSPPYYRGTKMYFESYYSAFKGMNIKATIAGKEYVASYVGPSYDSYSYSYVIKKIPVLPPGTVIKYTMSKGQASYSSTKKILKGDLNECSYLGLSKSVYVYSGKSLKPTTYVDYCYDYYDEKYIRLKKNTDYKVTYSNNKNVGKAKVTVTGINNYTGKYSRTFKILPKGTSVATVAKGKKAFTVKWKKQAGKMSTSRITGYQIRYSTKSGMSGAKKVTVKGYSKTSKTVKNLQAKKKYYVQVRTYKTVSGVNYYSKWSKKKAVTTK